MTANLTTTTTTTILMLMPEDLGYPIRTPDVKKGDTPGKVIGQAMAQLGQKPDEFVSNVIKKDAYKRLDGALRKARQGDRLNELAKKALGKK